MTGTVESVQQDPPSFTLHIPQYLSVTGKDARPVLYLRCHLGNNKMWKDPKALLPHVKSVVSCAGPFSHYEWETRNGKRFARLNIDLHSIEFIAKTNTAATATPTSKCTPSIHMQLFLMISLQKTTARLGVCLRSHSTHNVPRLKAHQRGQVLPLR